MPPTDATVHLTLLTLSAVTTAGLAGYAWRHRSEPGTRAFVGLMLAVTTWTVCYAIAMTQTATGPRLFWERMQWLGIPFVSVTFLWFALAYTGFGDLLTRRTLGALALVAVLTVAAVWTNPMHHLVWTDTNVVEVGGLVLAEQTFGAWYWFHLTFAYGLIAVGSVLLLRLVFVSEYLYLDQSVLLLVGVVTPVLSNAVSVFGTTPLSGIDLTPYALTITGVAFGNALVRYRLFELAPATRHIGRNVAIRDLEDGVVIVDDDDRTMLYCNDAAGDIVGADPAAMIGDPLSAHLPDADIDLGAADALAELAIDDRTYEVRSSPITDQHDRRIGHTLVVSDITERKRRERRLQRQRDELQELDRINRVIREVNRALIGSTSCDEIESTVPERLAHSELYAAACIGIGTDVTAGTDLTCRGSRNRAGHGKTDGGESALVAAIRDAPDVTDTGGAERTLQVPTEDGEDPARCATVPLVYERTVYGVLVVSSTRPDAFGDRELAVLDELGAAIGHAVHAIETRRLLLSSEVVELELAVTDTDAEVVAVSEECSCGLELQGTVPIESGRLLAYVAVTAGDVDEVDAAFESRDVASRVLDEDDAVLELELGSGSLLGQAVAGGTNVTRLAADGGRCELTLEVGPDTDHRAILDRIRTAFPDTSLLSKRESHPGSGQETVPSDTVAELTDRQQEVLETAFMSGYYEWPRESTAEEIADSLEISSPTLHNHLRKAQRKVLGELLAVDSTDERRLQ
jgi:predicted DNA binding protein